METKIEIPNELQQVCKDLAKVAQQHKLYELSGTFRAPTNWGGDISFSWRAGRHHEDSDEINISSKFFVYTRVSEPKQSQQPK